MSQIRQAVITGVAVLGIGVPMIAQAGGQAGGGAADGGQAGAAGQAGAGGQPATGQPGAGLGAQGAQPGIGGTTGGINPQAGGVNPNLSGINPTPWFSDPGVRQQLQLNDLQFNRLNQMYGTQFNQYRQELNALRGQNLTGNDLRARQLELQQQFRQGFQQNFDEAFRDAPFRDRYNQLDWQYQGYSAFQNPLVAERLNLTQAQSDQLQRLSQQWRTDLQQLVQSARTNPAQYRERMRRMQADMSRQLRPVLNQDQYQNWQQMIGDPYQFSADLYFDDEDQIR